MTLLNNDTVSIHLGDSRKIISNIPDNSINAIITDPPYELGFMGNSWDKSGVAFDQSFWTEVYRVLHPEGVALIFGGTRTYHRMACAVEDAGFYIRDSIDWIYAQGFPKGSSLKPAHEPILLASKSRKGLTLNIEDARPSSGRYPSNVVFSHTQNCDEFRCDDTCPIPQLDYQSGITKSGKPREDRGTGGMFGKGNGVPCGPQYGDSGGASRFFPVFRYQAKAPKKERNLSEVSHPTVKPLELMRWTVRLASHKGQVILDPFAGSGTTGEAALLEGRKVILIESEPSYIPLIESRINRVVQ